MIRKLLRQLEDFFGISPKEARGALMLIALSIACLWFPTVFKWGILPLFQDDTVPFTIQELDSTAALIPDRSGQNGFEEESTYEPRSATNSDAPTPSRLFAFDPNTATVPQLQELGVPRFLALRIQNYRAKGGKFRRREDLKRIYDFPPALYDRLQGYISIPGDGPTAGTFESTQTNPVPRENPVDLPREFNVPVRPAPAPFDINTADTTQLMALRGIGSKLSVRILKFRDALGGFHSPDQYAEVFGLESEVVTELQRYARIQTPNKKIPINRVTAQELGRHPYLRDRKLNQVLINYREQHGPYTSPESLRQVRILDEATLQKIAPYLEF